MRDQPYADRHRASAERRMTDAALQPRTLPELIRWLRTEFNREVPSRLHEPGTEPDSALGSPKIAGAFRAYLMGHPLVTDHDDRLDLDRRGAARLFPMHASLSLMARKWPLSARYLFAIAWTGAEWSDVALAWHMLPEIGHRFTLDALRHLWAIWARDQVGHD
jgi:hypothetical protein